MPCGLVFRLEIIDLAYTYSIITLVSSGRVHTCSPAGQGGVRVTIARADIRTSTRIRRVMVLQQMSRRVQIAVRHVLSSPAMRASMQEQCPWPGSFPPRLLPPAPPWLSHHPCIPPSFLYLGSHGSWAGRAAPSCPSPPRSWETSGPHIREGQPANLTSLDVTSRGPSLRPVFALGGPDRLSSASLLRLRKSSPHPQTSSRAQPVTTSRCDTVLSSPSLLPGITS